ncbi:hypothetical protein [Mesorhizobium sp. M2A.F.Ca.ET.039.01.1.1]|uniref:hypothetical protein n=1 Tax=Mesorhizobium sp. M2A.F.Ca.ET.039.01.1.1 TaxID=2496746 RepID=UPI000FCA071B|nr:hypothetical protein [Mesorhizobium sp. M2A.F.Ca.ET.039.01.1.1]RWX60991.1 hypothetical protein EOA24_31505 [Mesorhizobium sp. M2A.F.Ca.ET.039.01.1.1]
MAHVFTTLRHSVERLREAEYFLVRLPMTHGLEFQANLNAFLSASRSVTFLLQSSLAHVPGFEDWYRLRRQEMSVDPAMRFFLDLRNISQKQGPVSYVGSGQPDGTSTHRFVAGQRPVPPELVCRDIAECCAEHVMKLARLLHSYFVAFPVHACPVHAFTEEGMITLGYTLADVEEALGLPDGYISAAAPPPIGEALRYLQRELEPLNVADLERLSVGEFQRDCETVKFPKASGGHLVDDVAAIIELSQGSVTHPRNVFMAAVMKRIDDMDPS